MSSSSTTMEAVQRPSLINSLFPSVISGIVLGVAGAAVAGLLVNRMTTAYSPDSVPNDDAVAAAVYTAWVLFFFIGVGAFNGVIKWAFARREPTPAEELQLAGKDQGLWRYFRFTTDHKVVGMQYLATVFVLFFLGSLGAFMIRPAGAVKTWGDLLQPQHVQHHCGHAWHPHDCLHHHHDQRSFRQFHPSHHDWGA